MPLDILALSVFYKKFDLHSFTLIRKEYKNETNIEKIDSRISMLIRASFTLLYKL